ncbi:MAG TPA: hypothetical protein VHQ65_16125, partial [Thermoanaerobaculia bacterium]|nr:hypothetical protein [Thermoanaerobaculia bacterium]
LAEAPAAPRTVRTTEERLLDLLLGGGAGGTELPRPEELPPPDVFFDPECRNIYRVWSALYRESGTGSAPDTRAVLAALGQQGAAVDRMARLLVGGKPGPAGSALPDCLDKLTRRWLQQRLKGLSREIAEAQRAGDRARLDHLVAEKTQLSRRLHRSP